MGCCEKFSVLFSVSVGLIYEMHLWQKSVQNLEFINMDMSGGYN